MNFLFTLLATLPSIFVENTHNSSWEQRLQIDEVIFSEKTNFQEMMIFKNRVFGKVLIIDNIVQLTEKDEAAYHEMLVHVPLLSHENPRHILIIGGGDGGVLREVLRHSTVEKATMVEIDPKIIERCKQFMPSLSNGAFDDPRLELIIGDGMEFVQTTDRKFDVVICDTTDPDDDSEILYHDIFYRFCKKILTPKGILVNQNGCPFAELKWQGSDNFHTFFLPPRAAHFKDARYYLTTVPCTFGGFVALGWSSNCEDYKKMSQKVIESRLKERVKGEMEYYNPAIHIASFAVPEFMKNTENR